MKNYLFRRLIYAVPILLGINFITFFLFFMLNSPDDMARIHLGNKNISQESVEMWKFSHGYNLPLFFNSDLNGLDKFTNTLFYQKSVKLFLFDFGMSDSERDISEDVFQRMWPSLNIAIPILILGIFINIIFAMTIAFFRTTYIEILGVFICIILISISGLFYIIGGQYFIGKLLKLLPISGYEDGFESLKFVLLPVFVGIIGGIGSGTRWYRTLFIEEISKDYIKAARAKGISESRILFSHLLPNVMLPILTGVVAIIPTLFMGSLLLESFFGIPGLGSYTIDAIQQQDFAIVRSMVFLGSFLYLVGLLVTDILYLFADPRVRLR